MMFWSRDTFLINGVTVADFSVLGTMPSLSDRLTILVSIGANGSISCLIIEVGIGSKPHDFAFDFCTIFLISSSVTAVNLVKVWGVGRSEEVMVLVFMLFVVDPSNLRIKLKLQYRIEKSRCHWISTMAILSKWYYSDINHVLLYVFLTLGWLFWKFLKYESALFVILGVKGCIVH